VGCDGDGWGWVGWVAWDAWGVWGFCARPGNALSCSVLHESESKGEEESNARRRGFATFFF
jgi:hypothetical protein